ncbi:Hypothetical protein PAS_chr2-1_0172 [Komagataella phaffii GS115]|uniref:Uncharacterized protein n=1 Tax=Komagataella phaffii (strain GS115 / ATCC 20864) TaxID=644223 RepID=C4QZV5_KOMPG|nr:Hypothetical protein PAS_chr2-1_0172 [Komagataella phaffii GS115]CAY68779.1 Hypothetical protein PAS_chr2-1_0172 [Komagataella phaffii GS115]
MFLKSLLSFASILTLCKAWDLEDVQDAPKIKGNEVPGRYIIEYEEASTSAFATQLRAGGYDFNIQYDYSTGSLFNGASVQISNDNKTTFQDLQSLRAVKNVYPATLITLDETFELADTKPWNPHGITGVDSLHEQGYTGSGVVIAVIDTGVDYTHPALGGGIGDNFPIKAGYDLSSGDGVITNDPMDCDGHGTFVSSIIVANNKDMVGVAPDAQIVMYKVFPCSDSTSTDIVMAGMQKAYDDGHKIISLSLGSDSGFSSTPASLMASRIAQDRVVLVAAGNSGELGPFYASSPASGKQVISVGSVQNEQWTTFPVTFTSSNGESRVFPYLAYNGAQIGFDAELEVDFTEERGCVYEPEISADNANKAILLRRGVGCVENLEFNLLSVAGYKAYFLYNSFSRPWSLLNISPLIELDNAYSLVEEEVGIWVKTQIDAGNTVKLKVSTSDQMLPSDKEYLGVGKMDYYSSQGPAYELEFFPTISAPGGDSWGAWPGGQYGVASGTSFACPYVAGLTALYESQFGIQDPQDYVRKLVSTATDLQLFDWNAVKLETSMNAPLIQQGAGLVNALGLFETKTVIVSAPYLELNDTINRASEYTIQIKNENSETITYQVVHVPGTTVYSRSASGNIPYLVNQDFAPYGDSDAATVALSTEELVLGPGEVGEVTVIFSTEEIDQETAPIIQGKITFYGDVIPIAVPYMGVEVDIHSWEPLIERPLSVRMYLDDGSLAYVDDDPDYEFNVYDWDSPRFYFNLRYATKEVSIDLVHPDYSIENDYEWPLVSGHNNYYGPVGYDYDYTSGQAFLPRYFQQRINELGYLSFSRFANFSVVPAGEYKALFRVLLPYGDFWNKEDWQLFESPVFNVLAPPNEENTTEEPTEESSEEPTEESTSESTEEPSSESTEKSSEVPTEEITEDATSTIDDDEASTESSTEEPSAQPTGPYSDLTVGEAITDVSVTSLRTTEAFGYTSDWLVVSFTFNTTDRDITLPPYAVVQVTIPNELQFIAHPEYAPYLEPSLQVFYTKNERLIMTSQFNYDTRVIDFKFDNRDQVITQVEGVVYFTMKLEQDFISALAPGEYDFEFHTSVDSYASTFDFIPLIRSEPIKLIAGAPDEVEWFIDIPSAYSDLATIDISSDIDTNDNLQQYFYDCSKLKYTIGKEFDQWGNFTAGSDGNQYSNTTDGYVPITDSTGSPVAEVQCLMESISLSFTNTLAEDEVLRVVLHSSAFRRGSFTMANVVNVDITAGGLAKRELFSYILDENYYASTGSEGLAFDVFEVADQVEEPTEESTSEESTEQETSTEEPTEESTEPTEESTQEPTEEPTDEPTSESTEEPSEEPTSDDLSIDPTAVPTDEPTEEPTEEPTSESTEEPSEEPTSDDLSIDPTAVPTDEPTEEPTEEPTSETTDDPSIAPTAVPTSDTSSGQSVVTQNTTVTQTTITSVCNVCAETPVTITYTAPVVTKPVSYTTVTSVCHVCAETPITVTLTLPCETEDVTKTAGPKTVTYTEVCNSCADKPITYTYIAPEYTQGAERTTVTSVCNVCAETPVTLTYTAPKASRHTVPSQYSSAGELISSKGITIPTVPARPTGTYSKSVDTSQRTLATITKSSDESNTVTTTQATQVLSGESSGIQAASNSTSISAPTVTTAGNENSGSRFSFAGLFTVLPLILFVI